MQAALSCGCAALAVTARPSVPQGLHGLPGLHGPLQLHHPRVHVRHREMQKFLGSYFITWDNEMFDEELGEGAAGQHLGFRTRSWGRPVSGVVSSSGPGSPRACLGFPEARDSQPAADALGVRRGTLPSLSRYDLHPKDGSRALSRLV